MPLSLAQYADSLDSRDLPWPKAPDLTPPKAKPHLSPLPGVRAVMWNLYGTLLRVSHGELLFEHPVDFVMETALDKTIREFKMWQSMSRKPGQPAEYMKELYSKALFEQRAATGEVRAERVWESLIKKLFQKDYAFDAGFYGSLNEYSEKVAYFFHASLQGTACPDGAAATLSDLAASGVTQGLLADGQCFSCVQLDRGLKQQGGGVRLDEVMPSDLRVLSYDRGTRKPGERIFQEGLASLERLGIGPREVLHVGSNIERDVRPAKKFGMRTALYAGDKISLSATADQLKDPASRPDVLLTDITQVRDVVG